MKVMKFRSGILVCLAFFVFLFSPSGVLYAGPHEFSAGFYEENGINPVGLTVPGPGAVPVNFGSEINNMTGGFNNGGNVIFYTANAAIWEDSFTNNAAGQEAFETAEQFVAWIFPKIDGNPLSPAPTNRRQDNIFDTRGGYFSNNPLGLWRLEFIQWRSDQEIADTGLADRIDDCADLRLSLLEKNGPSLDGDNSPIFRTSSEVRNAIAKGCASAQSNPMVKKGQGMFRWVA